MLEGNNSNFEAEAAAEQRIYADDGRINFSLLKRLEKKLDDMFLQMGPKLADIESKILKLELAVNELSTSMKSNTEHDGHHHNQSKQRILNLQFSDKISSPVRTGEEIKGVGGHYLGVTLVNETGELVDSGPESSAEVHIFALKGDVDDENEGESGENGLCIDDSAIIAKGKNKKKGTVLLGDVHLKLNKGVGILANIKFRNSASHVSGMFKIGARVVIDSFHSGAGGVVVRDANTTPFKVQDYRSKYNEKRRPPSLNDEVWRLDNIRKSGSIHKRLKNLSFETVEDFLFQLLTDSDGLKQLVDLPLKKWEATVKHALTCQVDVKIYCSINYEENRGIVFNAIQKVLGLILQNKYFPWDELSHEDKVYASKVDIATYVRNSELIPFPNEASVLQRFVGLAEPLQHLSQLTTVSENAMDYPQDEVSSLRSLPEIPEIDGYFDEFFWESPLATYCSDQNTTTRFTDMLNESPVVAVPDNQVKKKLFLLFTITKWFLNYDRMIYEKMASAAASSDCSDTNDNQKRRRISYN